VNLRANIWDVPVTTGVQVPVIHAESALARLPVETREMVDEFVATLVGPLDRFLTSVIPAANYRARQVSTFCGIYRAQLIMLLSLEQNFGANRPGKLLISEHDAGFFHGPLMAFAARHGIPAILVPHSKVMMNLEFDHDDMTALTHPMQGIPIRNAKGSLVPIGWIDYPAKSMEIPRRANGLRVVALLLNALTINGVPIAPTDIYLEGIKRILNWCKTAAVSVRIRFKPGNSMQGLFIDFCGADCGFEITDPRASLESYARDCDLCLMYEAPTTAVSFFLQNGIAVLNPQVVPQSPAQQAIVHTDLVPSESVAATLCRLEGFKADALALDEFRATQSRLYLAKRAKARPLRSYLLG